VLMTTPGHDEGRWKERCLFITDRASRYLDLRFAGSPGGIHNSAFSKGGKYNSTQSGMTYLQRMQYENYNAF
jgi:hypothetical protein